MDTKKKLKIAIDSPAAAGAGTLAKKISHYYNLYYLDTGKIYRYIAYLKIKYPKKFSGNFIKRKIKKLSVKELKKKRINFRSSGDRGIYNFKKKIYSKNCSQVSN